MYRTNICTPPNFKCFSLDFSSWYIQLFKYFRLFIHQNLLLNNIISLNYFQITEGKEEDKESAVEFFCLLSSHSHFKLHVLYQHLDPNTTEIFRVMAQLHQLLPTTEEWEQAVMPAWNTVNYKLQRL